MKTKTIYICEVCNREYSTQKMAEECESGGAAVEYPIGMISGYYGEGDLIFAVAENRVRGHINKGGLWATRDNRAGDNLGKELCGGSSLGGFHPPNPKTPAFQRMIDYLTSKGIDITVWDGQKPVPLDEWIKKHHSETGQEYNISHD